MPIIFYNNVDKYKRKKNPNMTRVTFVTLQDLLFGKSLYGHASNVIKFVDLIIVSNK